LPAAGSISLKTTGTRGLGRRSPLPGKLAASVVPVSLEQKGGHLQPPFCISIDLLDPVVRGSQDRLAMARTATRDRRRIWFVVAGAVVGVALGIFVSVVTDVPLAPEAGLLFGALVGWFLARSR
jgi:hypothetical protein